MPIKTITHTGRTYPALQATGNAARFALPFAQEILKDCKRIYDVGCNRVEWCYPGAIPVDPAIDSKYSATCLPQGSAPPDAIFSSHMLEHYAGSWADVLDYWHSQLVQGGIVFLYLPHFEQTYWRSWSNRKHVHNFTPEIIRAYFVDSGKWLNVFVTHGWDLNHSFYAVAEKRISDDKIFRYEREDEE